MNAVATNNESSRKQGNVRWRSSNSILKQSGRLRALGKTKACHSGGRLTYDALAALTRSETVVEQLMPRLGRQLGFQTFIERSAERIQTVARGREV